MATAERKIVKAHAAPRRPMVVSLIGQTKGGKTTGAWVIAKRLCELEGVGLDKILFIDTEAGRSTYTLDLMPELSEAGVVYWNPPYNVPELTRFLQKHQDEYAVIVIDSFSAFYSRAGGTLREVEAITAAQTSKNTFAAWKRPGQEYDDFLTAINILRCHVVVCARSKMTYAQEEETVNGRTKKVLRARGVEPIFRKSEHGFEFDIELNMVVEDDKRWATVIGSRLVTLPVGKTWEGGVSPEVVDIYWGAMQARRDVVRPDIVPTISVDEFTVAWRKEFDNDDAARIALGLAGDWRVLKQDGAALYRLLLDRREEVARALEDAGETGPEPTLDEGDGESDGETATAD